MKYLQYIKSAAEQQHGVVTRRQLVDFGCSDAAIWAMTDNGTLTRVGFGVYRFYDLDSTWFQKAAIAVLSCGHNAYLSHESVLVYFGLLSEEQNVRSSYGPRPLRPFHVIANTIGTRDNGIIIHECKSITHEDLYSPSVGIPHVSLERSFVDSTSSLSDTELDYSLQKAFQRRLSAPKKLVEAIDRAPNGRGRQKKRLRKILDPYMQTGSPNQTAESHLEKRVQRVIQRNTDVECYAQYALAISGRNYRLDFAIPIKMIAIEVDGFEFHRNRTSFDHDRVRQNALVAAGWTIIRVTSSFTDQEIADAVLNALQ